MATLLHKHPHVPPTTFGEGAFPTCLSHMFSPRIKRQRRRQCAQQRQDAYHPTTLDTSRQLARLRAEEFTKSSPPLVNDPFAQHLVETMDVVRQNPLHPLSANTNNDENIDDEFGAAFDLAAARFVDDQVLLAASHVNTGREQGYNQVVLLGDAFCTRAFRLPWSPGTVIYLIAPAEGHERAEALLSSHTEMKARVPRGCLLRRVDCSITEETNSCAVALQRAGYRSDRLSVWALQGIRRMNLSASALASIFADMSNQAALESVLVGELPPMSATDVDNLLASFGFLGTTFQPETVIGTIIAEEVSLSSWWGTAVLRKAALDGDGKENCLPKLFRAQQRRLSLQEIEMYESHVSAAEEVDEDFFGNFS